MNTVLQFPAHRARDAAAVRQMIRMRSATGGYARSDTERAERAAVQALLVGACSAAWAIHVGYCVLRGRPLPRLHRSLA